MADESAVAFFYVNASYSYNPNTETEEEGRQRSARLLAEAESHARNNGWETTVEDDDEPLEDDVDSVGMVQRGEAVCLIVTVRGARDNRPVTVNLGNVIVPSRGDPYVRVVAAELAAEIMSG